jgi:hypothetical protein
MCFWNSKRIIENRRAASRSSYRIEWIQVPSTNLNNVILTIYQVVECFRFFNPQTQPEYEYSIKHWTTMLMSMLELITKQDYWYNKNMVDLIHERFATYYHAKKLSSTFAFCFFLYFLIILVPFLISFTAGGISSHFENRFLDSSGNLLWATLNYLAQLVYACCADNTRLLLLHEYPGNNASTKHLKSTPKYLGIFYIKFSGCALGWIISSSGAPKGPELYNYRWLIAGFTNHPILLIVVVLLVLIDG